MAIRVLPCLLLGIRSCAKALKCLGSVRCSTPSFPENALVNSHTGQGDINFQTLRNLLSMVWLRMRDLPLTCSILANANGIRCIYSGAFVPSYTGTTGDIFLALLQYFGEV